MAKKKPKKKPDMPRLQYLGKDGNPYITGIPARDLDTIDLVNLCVERGQTMPELIEMLTNPPNNREPLYALNSRYSCETCQLEFKTWNGMHEHILKKHTDLPSDGTESTDNPPLGG